MKNFVILEEFPNYEIWRNGKIMRKKHVTAKGTHLQRKEIAHTKARNGYETIRITDKNGMHRQFYVHRLVWMAFNDAIPKGMEIDHISTDKSDNSLKNLRVVTHMENCRNPKSIMNYKEANSSDKGKYDYERLCNARGKEGYEKAIRNYYTILNRHGSVNVWLMVTEGHCGYPRARKICQEMSDINKKMGIPTN